VRRASCTTIGCAALLIAASVLGACDDDDSGVDPVKVTIEAALQVDDKDPDRVIGTIRIDLSLPEGAVTRDLVLRHIVVGEQFLDAATLSGLEDFPRHLGGGERASVDLVVDAIVETPLEIAPALCAGPPSLGVAAHVLDVAAAEAGAVSDVVAEADAEVETAFEATSPAPIALSRSMDLGAFYSVVAMAPAEDEDLLVASGAVVERVGPDGARRWRATDLGFDSGVQDLARGGGVDGVLAWADPDGLPCDPSPGDDERTPVLARLDEGALRWCVALDFDAFRLEATEAGELIVAALAEDGVRTRLLRFSADGEALDDRLVAAPPGHLLALGNTIVIGGYDPSTFQNLVAIVEGDETTLVVVDGWVSQITERADGSVGLLLNVNGTSRWSVMDPTSGVVDVGRRFPFGDVAEEVALVELPSGSLAGVATSTWYGDEEDAAVTSLQLGLDRDERTVWSETVACDSVGARRPKGAASTPVVLLDAPGLQLGGVELAPEGPPRTFVVWLAETPGDD